MIGNDLVDLQQADKDSNWGRKGFIEKVFTASEQFLINSATQPAQMVWLLWSMKEAAYKIHTRDSKMRSFAPTSIQCNNLVLHEHTASGVVFYEGDVYYTQTEINSNYIHTLAAQQLEHLPQIEVVIEQYDPSNTGYRLKNPNCVSHHGRYLALVFI
jgi:phosphopantetheinyl transferase (holo-ACP synthase)